MTAQTPGPVARIIIECQEDLGKRWVLAPLIMSDFYDRAYAHDAEDARKDEALRTAREALIELGGVRDDGRWHYEVCVGVPAIECYPGCGQARAAIAAIDEVLHG